MTNPDKPLIEVEKEERLEDDTLNVRVSIDLKLAVLSMVLILVACGVILRMLRIL